MDEKKGLSIDTEDFKRQVDSNCYLEDKSLLIKDVIDECAVVRLITRPEEFGESFNLSMFRYFFEKTVEDTSYLFKGLQIWQQGEEYTSQQGQYPVVHLSFKHVKFQTYDQCYEYIKGLIASEFSRHRYILESELVHEVEKRHFIEIESKQANTVNIRHSLKLLTSVLHDYHNKDVIILVDEYDTPIIEGAKYGYRKEIIYFLGGLFICAFKGNIDLETAVVTGASNLDEVLDIGFDIFRKRRYMAERKVELDT